MTTEFQRKLIKDLDTLWEIVKIYHPTLPDLAISRKGNEYSWKEKMRAYWHYDWVCIEIIKIPDYGSVHIGINNSQNYTLYGPRVTKAEMKTAIEDGSITMDVWRFAGDAGNRKDTLDQRKLDAPQKEKAVELLYSKGYTLQSVDEFFKIYYKD